MPDFEEDTGICKHLSHTNVNSELGLTQHKEPWFSSGTNEMLCAIPHTLLGRQEHPASSPYMWVFSDHTVLYMFSVEQQWLACSYFTHTSSAGKSWKDEEFWFFFLNLTHSGEICPMLQRKINLWEGKLASLLTLSCKTVGKHKFSILGTNCFTRLKINCTLSPTGLSYKPGSWTGTPDWKLVL